MSLYDLTAGRKELSALSLELGHPRGVPPREGGHEALVGRIDRPAWIVLILFDLDHLDHLGWSVNVTYG